jgi:hypothetical protein
MLTDNIAAITPDEARETLGEAQERLVLPAPVLISEHEVALATAIALRPRPTTRRRWFGATHVLLAVMRRSLVPSTQEGRPVRRDYPKRYTFLENACLAREMDRL